MKTYQISTTFVLHGGRYSINSPDNDDFFRQCTDLVEKKSVHILLCYWAHPEERWEMMAARDKLKINKQTTKKTNFSVVMDVSDLYVQIIFGDVLFVSGGEAEFIEPYLPKLTELREKLRGKVYVGSSMGAFIVSSHYVLSLPTQDENTVHHSLGLLPVSTLCHWNIEKRKKQKIDLLQKEAPNLPIVLLDEQKFITIVN